MLFRSVFNCNDGAKIENALPLRPEDIEFVADDAAKGHALEIVEEAFRDDYSFDIDRAFEKIDADYADIQKFIEMHFAAPVYEKMGLCDIFSRVHKYFDDKRHNNVAAMLIRGSVTTMAWHIYQYSAHLKNGDDAVTLGEEGLASILDLVEKGKEVISAIEELTREILPKGTSRADGAEALEHLLPGA